MFIRKTTINLRAQGQGNFVVHLSEDRLMSHSYHIQSVLIGIEYRNCRQTLDVYLLFAALHGQVKSKVNYRLVTYKLASP